MNRYDNVTFMLCLPRSRSAWLAQFFLTYIPAMHDTLGRCESIDEFKREVDAKIGWATEVPVFVAETAGIFVWNQMYDAFPHARFLFVDRNAAHVRSSLRTNKMSSASVSMMSQRFDAAKQALYFRGAYSLCVPYERINAELRNIWRFVGMSKLFDERYAQQAMEHNYQVPVDVQRARMDPSKFNKLLASAGINYTA